MKEVCQSIAWSVALRRGKLVRSVRSEFDKIITHPNKPSIGAFLVQGSGNGILWGFWVDSDGLNDIL